MQIKFIKEVVSVIVGKQAEDIVDLLSGKNNINEFIISKKLNLTINQTRNILYKLSDFGLVSSIRKKDKKKGWYTYFWRLETLKTLEFLRAELKKKIEQIKHQIKSRESKIFYMCNRCNIEFNEENALLHDFTCSECGDVFAIKDNSKLLKELKKSLNNFEKELEEVEQDISKEKEIEEKKKLKEERKEASKKIKQKKARKISNKNKQIKEKKIHKKNIPKISKRSADKKTKKKNVAKKLKKKTNKKTSKKRR